MSQHLILCMGAAEKFRQTKPLVVQYIPKSPGKFMILQALPTIASLLFLLHLIHACILQSWNKTVETFHNLIYHMRAIITRGLYTFYPLFEVQKRFFKGLFS